VRELITFPAHAMLIVEERQREEEREGTKMPEGMPLDELALRMLIAAALCRRGGREETATLSES
jgi:hypothetical protein